MRHVNAALFAALAAFCSFTYAEAPTLAFPLECTIGAQCFLQNYVDHDPGPGATDYRCGRLTYDGHKGTDIRLVNVAAMNAGVSVLAAAGGRVRAVRDGMEDVSVRRIGPRAVAGREAGNSVVIEHGDGWETQYAHMRRGSIVVKPGDAVRRGQRLGFVGMSGLTEFPHLHFEVRHRRETIDPFTGGEASTPCGPDASAPSAMALWTADAVATLKYVVTGLVAAGFAGGRVVSVDASIDNPPAPGPNAVALVFWVHVYGVHRGDIETLRIVKPDGGFLAEMRNRLLGDKADWLSTIGRPRDGGPWPRGSYRGEYRLTREEDGKVIDILMIVREVQLADGTTQGGVKGE